LKIPPPRCLIFTSKGLDNLMISQRIIFSAGIDAFGGVERLILSLSRFLHDRGLPHVVVCFSDTIDFASFADWPIAVVVLSARRNPISEGYALQRYLRTSQTTGSPAPLLFDLRGGFYAGMFPRLLYHLHLTDPPSLLPSDLSKFAFSVFKSRLYSAGGRRTSIVERLRGEICHQLNRRGALNAASVIAMTHSIADELHKLYSVDATVIRPGVPMPLAIPRHDRRRGMKVRLLSVCRLEPSKRLDWILTALAQLESSPIPLSEKFDWILDVVGDGTQREELQLLVGQLGIAARVVFHGRISDSEVEDAFAGAGLFLMPAVQGYGLPALEALARGVPVVLHRASGVSEILESNLWVHIIEDSTDDLALAIDIMLERFANYQLERYPIPKFPTETDWARTICVQCKWI
jgi:glycosyltransferase involved in cell wall biosynthesis